jgi:hypothetical protein
VDKTSCMPTTLNAQTMGTATTSSDARRLNGRVSDVLQPHNSEKAQKYAVTGPGLSGSAFAKCMLLLTITVATIG